MPELVWTGKRFAVGYADEAPTPAIRRIPESSVGEGSGNRIVHGDNLLALKALLPDYREGIKLVFIDPPYNAGGEVWSYTDRIGGGYGERWAGRVEADDPLRHDKWLCMMYPRLALLRELLSLDGEIFITIGDNELHHLRLLMDEIFGPRNFLGCAVWRKGPSDDEKPITGVHNYVVVYARDRRLSSVNGAGLASWWTGEDFGDSREARRELEGLFPEVEDRFAIPKPTRLIRRVIEIATSPSDGDVVLDCFAGSGSTAHAVLAQNAADGGDRRFVLVESEDYADALTAERVRRILQNQGKHAGATGFDYYELDV